MKKDFMIFLTELLRVWEIMAIILLGFFLPIVLFAYFVFK